MSSITPRTSQTAQPGYVTNNNPAGRVTNQQWIDGFVEYWRARWARGDRTVPDGWVSAKYGEPDPSDTEGMNSPRTLLAFTRYAQDYQPGKDAQTDQLMPWSPPGPDEFIEDPVTTASRLASDQFNKQFDFNVQQTNIANGLQGRELDLQAQANINAAKAQALQAFNESFQNELTGFATQAEMYQAQEANRLGALGTAGNLSSALQSLYDQRGQNAIRLHGNPGDFVERELAVRNLPSARSTGVNAYKEVDTLGEVIRRLIDYTPTGGLMQRPVAPNQATFTPPATVSSIISSLVNSQPPQTPVPQVVNNNQPPAPPPPSVTAPNPASPTPPVTQADPDVYSGVRNEDVAGLTSGQRALRTTGTAGPSKRSDYTNFRVFRPQDNYEYQGDEEIAGGTPIWLQRLAHGGRTRAREFIAGDPQTYGKPNPELVKVHNPGPETEVSVTPLAQGIKIAGWKEKGIEGGDLSALKKKNAGPMKSQLGVFHGSEKPAKRIRRGLGHLPRYAYGTGEYDDILKSYSDETYQNMPSLSYFQGRMNRRAYNALSTGFARGAFGEQLPESGRINYNKYLNVAKDPLALAILGSQYRGGSRDLASEVARAKARAPLGQAIATSMIRT